MSIIFRASSHYLRAKRRAAGHGKPMRVVEIARRVASKRYAQTNRFFCCIEVTFHSRAAFKLTCASSLSSTSASFETAADLTSFLYQRDGEIIAFALPDLAVSGTGSLSAAPVVDIRAMSAA
jgi:hypothetical protein